MTKIRLSETDTRAPKNFSKEDTKARTEELKTRLDELQNRLYAEGKHAVLVIMQGMDASGKDGAVKKVFTAVNPLGIRIASFKSPTELEMKHDFLWRVHQHVPEAGVIQVFNRSHYEDVVIQRVHHWVDESVIKQRYEHINNFEQLLKDSGTIILKFYLHISPERQLERLQERMSDKTKMWKYNEADLKERQFWPDYMDAYERAFENCSKAADWHIIPADQNWYKEYLITKKLVDALESLKMEYPGLKV